MKNPYKILGVEKNASQKEIKKAYRDLAKKHHPDTADKSESDDRFKEISSAYSILSDPEKRKNFDQFGNPAGQPRGFHGSTQSSNASDFFKNFGRNFDDMFSGQKQQPQPQKGSDIRAQIVVSLEQAESGGDVGLDYDYTKRCEPCEGKGAPTKLGRKLCEDCHGSGNITHQQGFFAFMSTCSKCRGLGNILIDPCVSCKGKGVKQKHKSINVKIPGAITDGSVIRLRGLGNESKDGLPGNLLLVVHVRKHDKSERAGNDIHTDLQISVSQAMLGDIVKIDTLSSGKKNLNIPPGTQHDSKFKLKRMGVKAGHHIVTVKVKIPEHLEEKEKDLIEQFQRIRNDQ